MRTAFALSALAALAFATPTPQELDIDAIIAAPDPQVSGPAQNVNTQSIPYDAAAAKAAAAAPITEPVEKRSLKARAQGDCAPQSNGKGPKPPVDSDAAFLAYDKFRTQSKSAAVPAGYEPAFNNLQGSIHQNAYMGVHTFDTYDPAKCAQRCNAHAGCVAFNVFFERNPTVDAGPECPNPPAFTNPKCTLWGLPVAAASATNKGQYRGPQDANGNSFHVVITGSNGYNKVAPPPALAGFDGPTELDGAINAPLDNGVNTYMGQKYFNQAYDPAVCATACQSQTAYNKRHPTDGKYKPCNFFTAYVITVNEAPQGLYCALYSRSWDESYATNHGQWRGSDFYSVVNAYSYTLNPTDSGTI
ncbi:MAG: hypothetical protein M1833_002243 [Piccolia ochrophora]|nr:MAG: hypothetical protein M1833_002243 [Piccolia ochrophora]